MILILGLVAFVLSLIIATNIQNKKVKVMRDAVDSQSYFNATKVLEDKIALYHFAIDDSKQEVYCYSKGNEIRFKYKDIVDFEIQVDGITTMSNQPTSKGSSEGINVVINTISMSMAQEVSSIKVRIILRNRNIDMYDIECLALRVKTNDSRYKETYMKAQSIFDTLKLSTEVVTLSEKHQPLFTTSKAEAGSMPSVFFTLYIVIGKDIALANPCKACVE